MHAECHACIGGTNVREDMRKLEQGVHVVVGTPGRVYDMISRRALRASSIKLFVLDEADEMLSRGFKDQIHDVFKLLPNEVQVNIQYFFQRCRFLNMFCHLIDNFILIVRKYLFWTSPQIIQDDNQVNKYIIKYRCVV